MTMARTLTNTTLHIVSIAAEGQAMRDVKLVRKNMREKRTEAARNRRTGEMTERLTVSGATTQRDIDKLLELSNENQFGRNEAYYKLQRYEDLKEQGRPVILPDGMNLRKLLDILTEYSPGCPSDYKLANRCELSCFECWLAALKGADE